MRLGWNDASLRPRDDDDDDDDDDDGVDVDIDIGIIGAVAGGVGERDDRPETRPPSLMERDDPFEEEDAPCLLLVAMMLVR
jgi:hypothetical protein